MMGQWGQRLLSPPPLSHFLPHPSTASSVQGLFPASAPDPSPPLSPGLFPYLRLGPIPPAFVSGPNPRSLQLWAHSPHFVSRPVPPPPLWLPVFPHTVPLQEPLGSNSPIHHEGGPGWAQLWGHQSPATPAEA